MDEITTQVRAMYEQYPYPPAATPTLRVGSDVRLLLSFGKLARKKGRTLRVLDAGCGRAAGLIGAATLQPDVSFVGADLNRVALTEARAAVQRRGLDNVKFVTVDLMTLEGLEVPEGGFDVIISSGVLHHLSDPARGLARLREVLAPHGMISFMVYGREGRHSLYRTVRALDLLVPRSLPLEERLVAARALVQTPKLDALACGPFADAATVADIELVDRYLNVNETSYDVRSLDTLLAGADLRFLRWNEPEHWDPCELLPAELRDRANALSPIDRFALVEALAFRPMLDAVVCHAANEPRAMPAEGELEATTLAVSPEVSFSVESRPGRSGVRHETIVVKRRRESLPLTDQPAAAAAALILRDLTKPFLGSDLVRVLGKLGVRRDEVVRLLRELVTAEILYAPHAADV